MKNKYSVQKKHSFEENSITYKNDDINPNSNKQKYVIRAVDIPQNKNDDALHHNTAFHEALYFAQSRSKELVRSPQSYAEWREKTLKRYYINN